jgi:hypothetical protein
MGLLDWLRGGGGAKSSEPRQEAQGDDVRVGTPEEHVGVDPRTAGDPQEARVRIGTPEEAAAEDTYHGPIDTRAEDRHEEERARHSGI